MRRGGFHPVISLCGIKGGIKGLKNPDPLGGFRGANVLGEPEISRGHIGVSNGKTKIRHQGLKEDAARGIRKYGCEEARNIDLICLIT